jgi:hypothetical protein
VRRLLALWVAPTAAILALAILPLASGSRTLYLRDVLNAHLGMRAYLADALRAGELPLIDPLRAGGQALAGNPNALPFYPDNLLVLVGSTLWALNAHFWLHWLAAAAGACWLGRRRGLGREAAVATGALYALSGLFLSQLNLFNGVAPFALAPALAAAALAAAAEPRAGRGAAGFALATGLALLGGDPILAALAVAAALALVVAERGRRAPWPRLLVALLLAALVALPQLVETARALPGSFRGFWGFDAAAQAKSGPEPRLLLDALVPLFFGRPDLGGDWAAAAPEAAPRLYFTIAPGLIALALAAVGLSRRTRGAASAGGLAAAGLVAAFGWRALVALGATALPGGEAFRFPVKFLLLAALGLALAGGAGVERLLAGEGKRTLCRALALAAALEGALWLFFTAPPAGAARAFVAAVGAPLDAALFDAERVRWAGVCLISGLAAAAALAAARWLAPARALPLVVALFAASQWLLLRPVVATDERAYYERRPALADRLPATAVLCHGGFNKLFGADYSSGGVPTPDARLFWLFRRAHDDLFSFSGLAAGRRFEFDFSPEGLDRFVVQALGLGMRHFSDAERLRVLAATGVDVLLLARPLAADAAGARLLLEPARDGVGVFAYAVDGALEEVQLLGDVLPAASMTEAVALVRAGRIDPRRTALLAGAGAARRGPPGRARIVRTAAERIEVEADSPAGGVLVLRRAHLPLWRATVDGRAAPTRIAQLTRLAVELPPGPHRVVLEIARAPLAWALAGSAAALAALAALALRRPASGAGASGC